MQGTRKSMPTKPMIAKSISKTIIFLKKVASLKTKTEIEENLNSMPTKLILAQFISLN